MRFGSALLVSVLVACGLQVPPNVDKDNDLRRDDGEDNCPEVSNPDQSDFDGDTIGDACDTCDAGDQLVDEDRDGIPDACDGCVSAGADEDDDGIPDNCDPCVGNGSDDDLDGIPDNCDACVESGDDADGDGKDDACDDCVGSTADADMDGIEDGCDTCIAIGLDGDGDGLVDDCDPCDFGPNHDEDGDMHFDACDNCAAVPNPGQENVVEQGGPGGNIFVDVPGDACDMDPTANREIFDGFGSQNSEWYVQGTGWFLQNGAMLNTSVAPAYRSLGYADTVFDVWTVATAMFPQNNMTSYIGVYVAGDLLQEGTPRISCQVVQYAGSITGPRIRFTLLSDTELPIEHTAFLSTSSNTYDIRLTFGDGTKKATCTVNGQTLNEALEPAALIWYPGLEMAGGANAAFNFFDVITR